MIDIDDKKGGHDKTITIVVNGTRIRCRRRTT